MKSGLTKPFIFFGTEKFSLITLRMLIEAGYIPYSVVTKPDTPKGRGMKIQPPEVKIFAEENNIPVWQPTSNEELENLITSADKDFFGVLVSFGRIIPQSIIDLFNPGIINLHPSLLPKYRGPSPIESAILNGDQETGITIMQISQKMDAGPMYAASPFELTGRESKEFLYQTLGEIGSEALVSLLPAIVSGELKPIPQNNNLASYCSILTKKDSAINPEKETAQEIERKVRAHLGFPKTKLCIESIEEDIIITKCSLQESENPEKFILKCKNSTFIQIDELINKNGKRMPGESYLNGIVNKK